MKTNSLLVIAFFILSFSGYSQSTLYKPFEVDLGIVLAFPTNDDLKIGFGGYIEPKYNIHDNIALGAKLEFVAIASRVLAEIDGDMVDISVAGVRSLIATGDYYFTTEVFRPFIGIGGGIFILGDINYENDVLSSEHIGNHFGFVPRAGIVAGHFRLAVEYNIIPGLENLKKRDYVGVKLGFEIGGGKINK